jgi:lysophospholipase L1-like esterase
MKFRLIVLMLFAFLGACGGGSSSSSGGSEDKANLIVVIGDSIGAGIDASFAFPDLIASLTGIPVINSSVPGSNAEAGVSRAQGLIDQHNPRYIVALLGTNNALGDGGRGAGAINAMVTLSVICASNGVICVIGTLPPITLSGTLNGNARAISAGYRTVGGVRLADNFAVMNGSHIGPGGIHPNDTGQQIIGQNFANLLP